MNSKDGDFERAEEDYGADSIVALHGLEVRLGEERIERE